jgi:hypothetical protein
VGICEQYDWKYIIGLELTEDLKKAMKERMKPASPYDPCPCHSGKKYRFCCGKKRVNLISRIFECFCRFGGMSCA